MWRVTYEIVTPESAEQGDAAERGFISEGESSLRYALELAAGPYARPPAIQADSSPISGAIRWLDFDHGQDMKTGAHELRSLHIPDKITAASRLRLARYCQLI